MSEPSIVDRGAEDCYQRGLRLSTHDKNYDYAHVMFAQSVLREPSNLTYVEALLKNLREKFAGQKKKSPFRFGGSRSINKARQQDEWNKVLQIGVELLKANPWDVTALRAMAEACAALHYNEVELVYLKQALDADPKNIEVNRHCGRSLGRMGQFDQAIACWHRVELLRGKDEEAAKAICWLADEKLRYANGRPPIPSTPTMASTEANAKRSDCESGASAVSGRPAKEGLLASKNSRDLPSSSRSDETATPQGAVSISESTAPTNMELGRSARFPWLELALAAAVTFMLIQLYPSAAKGVLQALDVRFWTIGTWLLMFSAMILSVVMYRFRTGIFGQ